MMSDVCLWVVACCLVWVVCCVVLAVRRLHCLAYCLLFVDVPAVCCCLMAVE